MRQPTAMTRLSRTACTLVVPQDGANGWSLQGTTLTLEGSTCAAIQSGRAVSLGVVQGCPTVTR